MNVFHWKKKVILKDIENPSLIIGPFVEARCSKNTNHLK